jgi:hypothetical protein
MHMLFSNLLVTCLIFVFPLKTNFFQLVTCIFVLQITVYIGKRDFVDYLSHIDPIGNFYNFFCR